MRKRTVFILVLVIAFGFCCNIFNNDSGESSDSEWKKTSLPKKLQGDWYNKGFLDIRITSSNIIKDNREEKGT